MNVRKALVAAVAALVCAAAVLVAAATAGTAAPKLRIGMILNAPVPGSSWNLAWDRAAKYVDSKLGTTTTEVTSVPEGPDSAPAMESLIKKGNQFIVAAGITYVPFVNEVAPKYPKVHFVVVGPWFLKTPMPKNVSTVFGNTWEIRYLNGIAAALVTKSKVLGYVTPQPLPSVLTGVNAFELGAKSVDPSITTHVVFTGHWFDVPGATQATNSIANAGGDVIASHEDDFGTLLAAKKLGIWQVGSDSDLTRYAPNTYLTGWIWNWGPYVAKKVQQALNGTFTSEQFNGGINSGIISLGPINPKVAGKVAARVNAAMAKIRSGKLAVFTGPLKSNAGKLMLPAGKKWVSPPDVYTNMTFLVDGVVGSVK